MLEAGALGVPVLATKTQGATEILENGVDGLLVDVDDIPALSEALIWLLSNREASLGYAEILKAKVIISLLGKIP